MDKKPTVMISSTARDLPDYRSMVMDACLRSDFVPNMMEHLSALHADAIEASLGMVDESDIYLGIFAHRYGYIPEGHDISITEMEYNRAVQRKIPILIFIIDNEVPVKPKNFDTGTAAEKLKTLKEKLQKKKVVAFFDSPRDLRGQVINSLEKIKKKLDKRKGKKLDQGAEWAKASTPDLTSPQNPKPSSPTPTPCSR
ncbi:MAG: DUF4062 domain-containing protein [Bacteroidota bacterium]